MAEPKQPGPLGTFSDGKMSPDDGGDVNIGVGTSDDGKILLYFGVPTLWIGFTPERALEFASKLHHYVEEFIEKRKNTEDGSTKTGDQS